MDFEIRFKGLLAFVTYSKPDRQVVALMVHQDHVPLLSVHKDFLQTTTETPTENGELRCFELTGRLISSLGSGVPGGDIKGAKGVPSTSLGFPAGANADASAHRGQPDASRFSAVFELPDVGELKPLGYYIKKASYNNGTSMCIPQSVIYTTEVKESVTFYLGDLTHYIVINGGASVSITNIDPSLTGGHYHAYESLFVEDSTFKYEPKALGEDCGEATALVPNCTTGQDLDVDCSPVRFP